MFQIDLTPLEPGVHHITREVEPDALEEAPENPEDSSPDAPGETDSGETNSETPSPMTEGVTFGPVQVETVLDYQPDRVLVTLQARTAATLTCDRTLRRFEQPLSGGYAILFAAPGRNAPEESEEHDELRELPSGARHLDLTEAVRDTLLLAIPQRKVAPGAEEEELETVFGTPSETEGDAVDPRWDKLRQLRSDGNTEERENDSKDA